MRMRLAILAAKITAALLKAFGKALHFNGTYFPGKVALKICPTFLKKVAKPKTIIGVTGTDGKTTTCNLLIDALHKCGYKVLDNGFGSNVYAGVVAAFLNGVTLGNKCKYDIAVIEIDERSSHLIYPSMQPDFLVITNLFRDSMKRNAHPEFIFNIINRHMPEKSVLISNADDIISSQLGEELPEEKKHQKVFFGIDRLPSDREESINIINDARICPRCSHKLNYEYVRYHHIGKVKCGHCGFASPAADYQVKSIDWDKREMVLSAKGEMEVYPVISDSIFNVYNELTAITVLSEVGVPHDKIREAITSGKVTKTRYNKEKVGPIELITSISKGQNAVACSIVFEYVSKEPLTHEGGQKEVVLLIEDHGDNKTSTENPSWLYDCDFEFLKHEDIKRIVIGGKRCYDIAFRLMLAGVDKDMIFTSVKEEGCADLIDYTEGSDVYVLYDIYQQTTADMVTKMIKDKVKGEK